jgi:uncharacterized membrane protein
MMRMLTPLQYAVALVSMLALDTVWLTLQRGRYGDMVRAVQRKDMRVRYVPAVMAYALMYLAIVVLIVPSVEKKSSSDAAKVGALAGFVVYGIFNATNLAIFSDYPWSTALIDTAWGTFLFAFVAWLTAYVM